MQILFSLHADKFFFFGIVLARLGAMLLTAPLYGSWLIPLHIRILSVFVLAALVTPFQWHSSSAIAFDSNTLFFNLLANVLIGVSLGLAMMIMFSGVQLAGSLVCQSGQLATEKNGEDPTALQGPLSSRMLQWMALIIFVVMGGHRLMMTALLDSFQSVPIASDLLPERLHEMAVHMVSESFRLALRIGAPIITALLASTLVIGLAGRALPQINSFSIGLTVNLWTTFLTLFFSLTVVAYLFQDYVLAFLSTWKTML